MVGILNIVYVKEHLNKLIGNVEHDNVKLGFANKFGNKGSVIIRMTIDSTIFCFINSHFPAGENNFENRLNAL
jgi:hypothetical protein